MAEINVVPYIDVMLVMLVIFMVTAPLLTQGIEVELPKAGAEPIETSSERLPLGATSSQWLRQLTARGARERFGETVPPDMLRQLGEGVILVDPQMRTIMVNQSATRLLGLTGVVPPGRPVKEIVALRGDPPKGEGSFTAHPDGYSDSCELIEALSIDRPTGRLEQLAPDGHHRAHRYITCSFRLSIRRT